MSNRAEEIRARDYAPDVCNQIRVMLYSMNIGQSNTSPLDMAKLAAAELQALRQEAERLKAELSITKAFMAHKEGLAMLREALDSAVAVERKALRKFGHHLPGCKIPPYAEADNGHWAKECTCGFEAALSSSPAQEEK